MKLICKPHLIFSIILKSHVMTDARKNNGGPRAGAGRKPDAIKKKYRKFLLSDEQYAMAKKLGGSPWLQGVLNLKIKAAGE